MLPTACRLSASRTTSPGHNRKVGLQVCCELPYLCLVRVLATSLSCTHTSKHSTAYIHSLLFAPHNRFEYSPFRLDPRSSANPSRMPDFCGARQGRQSPAIAEARTFDKGLLRELAQELFPGRGWPRPCRNIESEVISISLL